MPKTLVETIVFADDATLHGAKQELHESDRLGLSGMDCFARVAQWGSQEHEGQRERRVYGQEAEVPAGCPPEHLSWREMLGRASIIMTLGLS